MGVGALKAKKLVCKKIDKDVWFLLPYELKQLLQSCLT